MGAGEEYTHTHPWPGNPWSVDKWGGEWIEFESGHLKMKLRPGSKEGEGERKVSNTKFHQGGGGGGEGGGWGGVAWRGDLVRGQNLNGFEFQRPPLPPPLCSPLSPLSIMGCWSASFSPLLGISVT